MEVGGVAAKDAPALLLLVVGAIEFTPWLDVAEATSLLLSGVHDNCPVLEGNMKSSADIIKTAYMVGIADIADIAEEGGTKRNKWLSSDNIRPLEGLIR